MKSFSFTKEQKKFRPSDDWAKQFQNENYYLMSVYKVCINFFSCVLNWPQHFLLHSMHVFARCEGAKRKVVSYLFFFALAKYFSISAGMCIVRVCFFKAFCRKLRPKWNIKWKIICPMKSTSFLCQLCQHCIHTAFICINAGKK